MEVNEERLRLLTAELRSGKHRQAKGKLCVLGEDGEPEGYCCLGVACIVAMANGLALDTADFIPQDREHFTPHRTYNSCDATLPPEVRDWYGFTSRNPNLRNPRLDHGNTTAAALNDNGMPFSWLADLFEEAFLP